jgi:23S rRNA (cytosine1962-C5)-methyltransferase
VDLLASRHDPAHLLPLYNVNRWQSGLLGFARTEEAHRHLVTGLETGSAKPTFLVVVQGKFKTRPQTITAAIRPVGPGRFAVHRKAPGGDGPTTRFEPLKWGGDRVLVRCRPGLMNHHQIRAHLESLGARVAGDTVYRGRVHRPQRGPMLLHLSELRFHHPGLKRAVTLEAVPPPDFAAAVRTESGAGQLDGLLTARARAALAARLQYLLDNHVTAFRVLNGRSDGLTGLVAELLGDVLVIQAHQGKYDAAAVPVRALADWYLRTLRLQAVYVKHFVKDRSRSGSGERSLCDPRPAAGRPAPEVFAVRDNGLTFLVRPYDGYAVGLFLDQRENRRRVRELAGGRRVLNLFSYTCGFSVAAAAGGAISTVSVDISRKALEWGKDNFAANDMALDHHAFINDNAFNYFKRAQRQNRRFDLIVIDPPSFSRDKKTGRVFTVQRDLPSLVAGAVSLLESDGIVLVSVNCRGATRQWLRRQVVEGAGDRGVTVMSTPRLPSDFAGDPDHAKTIIVRVGSA